MSKKQTASIQERNQLVAESLALLDRQIIETVGQLKKRKKITKRPWNKVVVCGMGGSALGADLVRYLLWQDLKVPIVIVNNYQLPKLVDKNSLVVISSYSGTTEEPIFCLKEALKKRLSVFVMSSGGRLIKLAEKQRLPYLQFDTSSNPSGQPRIGIGYSIAGLVGLLYKMGLTKFSPQDLSQAAQNMKRVGATPTKELFKKSLVIVASEHLIGTAHILSNQMNESAKSFAPYYALPELNHHLLEGLASLKKNQKDWRFVFIESDLYHQRTQKRYQITKKVIKKQGFKVYQKKFGGNRAEQALKMLYWSSQLTFQLAERSSLDAMAIPWVDFFKAELRK